MKHQLASSALLIIFSLASSLGGQLSLKMGATPAGGAGLLATLTVASRSPLVWLGLALYGLGALTWIVVLSRVDLSLVYPLGAINYALIVVLSRIFLGEAVPPLRWVAVATICVGIVLLARSGR